jgi:CheY-like chemotaxis protein
LDVYLIDQVVEPVAEALAGRGIPFAFVTAYPRGHLPAALQSRRCLHKPFTDQEIRSLVTAMTGAGVRSAATTTGGCVRSQAPKVLIVEDQEMLGLALAAVVEDCGCEPVGPVDLVTHSASARFAGPIDAALLDVYLIDQTGEPVAEVLAQRGIPFGVLTAYSRHHLPEALKKRPCLNKPFTDREIRSLITGLTGTACITRCRERLPRQPGRNPGSQAA